MASGNHAYEIAMYNSAQGLFDWTGSDFYAVLLNASYVPNFVTDTVYANISAYILTGCTPTALASLTATSVPVMGANSVTFTGVTTAQTANSIVVYYNNGSSTFLCLYYDTGAGLPYTTGGANITVDWNNVATLGPLFTIVS